MLKNYASSRVVGNRIVIFFRLKEMAEKKILRLTETVQSAG
jgi:hypothetical protein